MEDKKRCRDCDGGTFSRDRAAEGFDDWYEHYKNATGAYYVCRVCKADYRILYGKEW